MITVTLPVISLENSSTGSDAYLVDLPGWYDTAEPKLDLVRRSAGHGVFDQEPVYDDALFFSVVGRMIDPGNPVGLLALRAQLMGLKALEGRWPVVVTDQYGTRTAYVRLAGRIMFALTDERAVADFSIPLVVKDGRRYGATEVVTTGLPTSGGGIVFPVTFPVSFGAPGDSGRVVTTNTGEAETYSTIEVTGGLSGGFSAGCVELGREIRFERNIPIGSTVSVDLRTGQAFIDGQSPVSGFLTKREWWTNPPGASRTIQFNAIGAVTGTPTLTARTAPANP